MPGLRSRNLHQGISRHAGAQGRDELRGPTGRQRLRFLRFFLYLYFIEGSGGERKYTVG
jgi:hypothetical protein